MKYYCLAGITGAAFFPVMLLIAILGGIETVFLFLIYFSIPLMMLLEPLLSFALSGYIEGAATGMLAFCLSAWLTWTIFFVLLAWLYEKRNIKLQFPKLISNQKEFFNY